MNLGSLLDELEVPYARLHTAKNDANFTLKALLMLVVLTLRDISLTSALFEMLVALKSIVHASLDPAAVEVNP